MASGGIFDPNSGRRTVSEIMGNTECDRKKLVANNTVEWWKDGIRHIRLHKTDVITFMPNGDVVLNTNGWKTPTTKSRIHDFTPLRVWQEKGVWYINGHVFADGMVFHPDGTVTGEGEDPKETLRIAKKIRKYARAFVDELSVGNVPKPSGGDCWFCCFRTTDGNVPLGEKVHDTEHLVSHMDEKYYVPSLLVNALEAYPQSPSCRHIVGFWLGYHGQDCTAWHGLAKDQASKAITRYMKRMFSMADK